MSSLHFFHPLCFSSLQNWLWLLGQQEAETFLHRHSVSGELVIGREPGRVCRAGWLSIGTCFLLVTKNLYSDRNFTQNHCCHTMEHNYSKSLCYWLQATYVRFKSLTRKKYTEWHIQAIPARKNVNTVPLECRLCPRFHSRNTAETSWQKLVLNLQNINEYIQKLELYGFTRAAKNLVLVVAHENADIR